MRRIAFLFVLFVSIMLVVPCFASLPPVTDGLVGCWDFEEGSGTTALDSSGNGNNGVITKATYTNDTPSQIVSMFALRFNTTTAGFAESYVIIPDSPSLRPNSSLTLAAWVKTSVVQSRPAVIIGKQYSYALYDSYCLWYEWGYLNFYLRTATNQKYISIAQPSTNEWHHVVGTYDGSIMRLYVDGVERVNGTFTGSIVYDNLPLSIGADSDRADHLLHQGWDGLIDEVLIYNRALSESEILTVLGVDVSPPEVGTPILNPARGDIQPDQNVTVSVNVTDSKSGVKNVTLTYSFDNGTTWENPELMGLNTTSGLYYGAIPGQPIGTAVRFEIVAFDNAGNNVTKDGASLDYSYVVVPEFPSILLLPILFVATLSAAVLSRRRRVPS